MGFTYLLICDRKGGNSNCYRYYLFLQITYPLTPAIQLRKEIGNLCRCSESLWHVGHTSSVSKGKWMFRKKERKAVKNPEALIYSYVTEVPFS